MKTIVGSLAIVLALFSLAPSILPGAMSLMGLLASLVALIVSVFSVRVNQMIYFKVTATIVVLGVLLVNDGLRVWQSMPLPLNTKMGLYGFSLFVMAACIVVANIIARSRK